MSTPVSENARAKEEPIVTISPDTERVIRWLLKGVDKNDTLMSALHFFDDFIATANGFVMYVAKKPEEFKDIVGTYPVTLIRSPYRGAILHEYDNLDSDRQKDFMDKMEPLAKYALYGKKHVESIHVNPSYLKKAFAGLPTSSSSNNRVTLKLANATPEGRDAYHTPVLSFQYGDNMAGYLMMGMWRGGVSEDEGIEIDEGKWSYQAYKYLRNASKANPDARHLKKLVEEYENMGKNMYE